MWRAFFMALGISAILLGAEGLIVERAVLQAGQQEKRVANSPYRTVEPQVRRDFTTPEWAPWSFLSVGAVVLLYTVTAAKGSG